MRQVDEVATLEQLGVAGQFLAVLHRTGPAPVRLQKDITIRLTFRNVMCMLARLYDQPDLEESDGSGHFRSA